jgi:hypothetical protein
MALPHFNFEFQMSADYLTPFESECMVRELKQIDVAQYGSSE